MLTIVVWKWRPTLGYAHAFGVEQVHTMQSMLARHLKMPHRLVCITDDPARLRVETYPLWNDYNELPNPTGGGRPSCYRRLKIFSKECSEAFGPRILSLDLDMILVNDCTHLFDRPEPFVGLIDPHVSAMKPGALNGSMFLFDSEDPKNRALWEEFDPQNTPREMHEAGERGSDQGWLSFRMRGCPTWDHNDGVLRFGRDIRTSDAGPPPGARIINFAGPRKPWYPKTQQRSPWIKRYYK